VSDLQEKYVLELLESGKRIDGRKFDEYREIKIERGLVQKAEGSAVVSLGKTKVAAGVKLEIGEPFPDTPNEGILIVNAEFSPIASPEFEAGPPGEDAIELARIVDRVIRESKCLQLEKLVVSQQNVFIVFVDLHIINDHGNLIDASALAAITALKNARIPKVENGKIVREEFTGNLPVIFTPVVVSVCKVGNNFLIDPDLLEENVLDSRLVVGVRDDDKICAIQKQGSKPLKFSDVEKMLDIAIAKSKELRRLVG
jgi:exosome complex component RRP42